MLVPKRLPDVASVISEPAVTKNGLIKLKTVLSGVAMVKLNVSDENPCVKVNEPESTLRKLGGVNRSVSLKLFKNTVLSILNLIPVNVLRLDPPLAGV